MSLATAVTRPDRGGCGCPAISVIGTRAMRRVMGPVLVAGIVAMLLLRWGRSGELPGRDWDGEIDPSRLLERSRLSHSSAQIAAFDLAWVVVGPCGPDRRAGSIVLVGVEVGRPAFSTRFQAAPQAALGYSSVCVLRCDETASGATSMATRRRGRKEGRHGRAVMQLQSGDSIARRHRA